MSRHNSMANRMSIQSMSCDGVSGSVNEFVALVALVVFEPSTMLLMAAGMADFPDKFATMANGRFKVNESILAVDNFLLASAAFDSLRNAFFPFNSASPPNNYAFIFNFFLCEIIFDNLLSDHVPALCIRCKPNTKHKQSHWIPAVRITKGSHAQLLLFRLQNIL